MGLLISRVIQKNEFFRVNEKTRFFMIKMDSKCLLLYTDINGVYIL